MTCPECELALAMEESRQEIDRHLVECAPCRALAMEIRTNSVALSAMAGDELPEVRFVVMAQIRDQTRTRRVMRWGWALAAVAAAVVILFELPREQTIAPPPLRIAVIPPKIETPPVAPKRVVRENKTAPLTVKMLTGDPNVVIYWQIESKEGTDNEN